MTALQEYQRLEATGLWRAQDGGQRREVVVALGDATLVIFDPRSSVALAHWSLPATHRLNPGRLPAVYSPGPDSTEELEIADPDMILAMSRIESSVSGGERHPGRLRLALAFGLATSLVALSALWLPGAITRHAARVAPSAVRAEIGDRVLADLQRVTAPPCSNPRVDQVLAALHQRLFPDRQGRIVILPDALAGTAMGAAHLPGGLILLHRSTVEDHETPEVAAGFALAEAARAAASDPLITVLERAGPAAALGLLTSGKLPEGAEHGQAEAIVAAAPASLTPADLLPGFVAAGVSTRPYADALDPTGESVLPLIEADPARNGPLAPLMADSDWLALQSACGG